MAIKRTKPNSPLNIYYQNVNGLNNKKKREEFRNNVRRNNYDVICLTETKLKPGYDNSLLFDKRYTVFRCDRNLQPSEDNPNPKKGGGGVLIAVRNGLKPEILDLPNGNLSAFGVEQLWVRITLANGQQKNICGAYIPGDRGIQMTSHLTSLITNPTLLENTILIGDYNIPRVNFNADNAWGDLHRERRTRFRNMAQFFLEWGFTQFNHLTNENNVTLDLVLSHLNLEVVPATPLVRIDVHHPAILIRLIDGHNLEESSSLDMSFDETNKKEEEKDRIAAEKETERKKREERDSEKEKRESERKNDEERDRIAAEKEAERKKQEEERTKQEERDKTEAKREHERRNNNNYIGDIGKKVLKFAAKVVVGAVVGAVVAAAVCAVGFSLAPVLIACKTAVAILTVKQIVVSAVVIGSWFAIKSFNWW